MEIKQQLQRILIETVTTLCKNTLAYDSELCVEGLLGITMDKNEVFLVNMKEIVTRRVDNEFREAAESGDTCTDAEDGNKSDNDGERRKGRRGHSPTQKTDFSNSRAQGDESNNDPPDKGSDSYWTTKPIKTEIADCLTYNESLPFRSNANVTVEPVFSISQAQCTAEVVEMNDIAVIDCDIKSEVQDAAQVEPAHAPLPHPRLPGAKQKTNEAAQRIAISNPNSDHRLAADHQKSPPSFSTTSGGEERRPVDLTGNQTTAVSSQLVIASTSIPEPLHSAMSYSQMYDSQPLGTSDGGGTKYRNRRVPVFASLNYSTPRAYIAKKAKDGGYACNICGKKFQHNPSLHRHIRSHSGHSVLCPVCNTRFSRADSLRRHIKQCHQEHAYVLTYPGMDAEFCDNDNSLDGHLGVEEAVGGPTHTAE